MSILTGMAHRACVECLGYHEKASKAGNPLAKLGYEILRDAASCVAMTSLNGLNGDGRSLGSTSNECRLCEYRSDAIAIALEDAGLVKTRY